MIYMSFQIGVYLAHAKRENFFVKNRIFKFGFLLLFYYANIQRHADKMIILLFHFGLSLCK